MDKLIETVILVGMLTVAMASIGTAAAVVDQVNSGIVIKAIQSK